MNQVTGIKGTFGLRCMMTCVAPFFLFGIAFLCLGSYHWGLAPRFIDIINLLGVLTSPYPGAHNMFSTHCPDSIPAKLLKNTTIYLEDAAVPGSAAYLVPKDTEVEIPRDLCDTTWVGNSEGELGDAVT